jgi:chromosome segregation ATPase
MQSRYKILILLFAAILVLGTLTLLQSSDATDAVLSLRSFFSNQMDPERLPSITVNLWYGAFSLLAIIIVVLAFKIARNHDSQRRREGFTGGRANVEPAKSRPSDAASAKEGADSKMRVELKIMLDLLQEKDATITELENSLSAKQQLLQNRGKESDELKSKVNALTEQLTDFRLAKERAENALQQELKKTRILQAKDSIIAGLENNLTATQKLLQERSQEIDALKSEANALTEQIADFRLAKERAEKALQRELERTQFLVSQDLVVGETKDGLSGGFQALERELRDKQELLQTRNRELKAAKSKLHTLRERLTALETAKKQTENVLQQQLKQKTELLQKKDAALKELQESLSAKLHALEVRLDEKEGLLGNRDGNLETLGFEPPSSTESSAAKNRAQSLLLQELQNRAEMLEAKDVAIKELQQQLNSTVQALENARNELERVAQERDAMLARGLPKNGPAKEQTEGLPLRSDRKGINSKLLELSAARARAAASLQSEEAKRAPESNDPDVLHLKTEEGLREESTHEGANKEKT